ncbi:MAG: hydroxymethylglutaryl-CoA reductase, degradative [Methanocellales archaeon]|nr:hydroxymethylglutaryl-CoA reductase, degradative [Methanocellales archaeon]MDD3291083.1 hydroxymethylglutaryl-CoA reductase, degradative [Methanocellales archaeon]MDD5234968.1 hydroxymethylglutaryl-CoA reductase, degradative [Methanocellales archaeon]MDD5484661.1 hydroxymethylglutaryl-CoA reductase, degradative [Methanocellales archaeon]
MKKTSRISGLYKLSPQERLEKVKEFADLDEESVENIRKSGALSIDQADKMIENVIGVMELPLGIATNFVINGKDRLIPMAIEEPSVIAAASNGAKMARDKGGFTANTTEQIMIGQIQLICEDLEGAKNSILGARKKILDIANEQNPILFKLGGGAKDIEVRIIETSTGKMVITHLLVDCRDAMGANTVNTMCEAVAPLLERLTSGRAYLRIVSNLADQRLARSKAVFSKKALGGDDAVDAILQAYYFAAADPYRCATHNKGIMNGVTAVALATGNDARALEAGAHAYASLSGKYGPLTTYEKNEDGDLVGTIELPLAVGLVGGATKVHPVAIANLRILGVKTASELAEVMASVGLAQNLAALRALATEGIQRGHMSLHAKNIAVMAGSTGDMVDKVASALVREGQIRLDRAKELLEELSEGKE